MEMEVNHENLMTENEKLQARVFDLESRTSTKINHVVDRLDNVIKVVNKKLLKLPFRSIGSRYSSRINDVASDS